jgi:hypothetical protein
MEVFLLSLILVAVAFVALGLGIFFTKGGRFPETEVGHNRHMRELGITCAKCDERKAWNEYKRRQKPVIDPKKLKLDTSSSS